MEKYQLYVRSDTNLSVFITGNIHPARKQRSKMTVKEQLSASKQKIVLPNKELVGVKKEEEKRD